MTIREAIDNAIQLLETLGYRSGGDIHDDLVRAYDTLDWKSLLDMNILKQIEDEPARDFIPIKSVTYSVVSAAGSLGVFTTRQRAEDALKTIKASGQVPAHLRIQRIERQ